MVAPSQTLIEPAVVASVCSRLARVLAQPPHRHRPLWVDDRIIGWLDDARSEAIGAFHDVLTIEDDRITFVPAIAMPDERTQALDHVCRSLAAKGLLTRWRDERYAVSAAYGKRPLFVLERAAARFFGIRTYAVHVNGLVRIGGDDGSLDMWIARRSPRKSIDPNLLDNMVGGGIAVGRTVRTTLAKEAWEEAGISESLSLYATPVGAVHLCRSQPDGLQRETIFVHDLFLSRETLPQGQDDEVVAHRRVTITDAANLIANTQGEDVMTADASLVILDCLMRHGAIAPDLPEYLALDALRHPSMDPAT